MNAGDVAPVDTVKSFRGAQPRASSGAKDTPVADRSRFYPLAHVGTFMSIVHVGIDLAQTDFAMRGAIGATSPRLGRPWAPCTIERLRQRAIPGRLEESRR